MAKKVARKIKSQLSLPFTKANYLLFGLSILVIILGYIALAQPPVDGFLTLTVAPILLVVGYCVMIPFSIMYRSKPKEQQQVAVETVEQLKGK
jgi:uncharacterized membrane protein HdeD (DUF308 family)